MFIELSKFEADVLNNALLHQIEHDQKRVDYFINKFEVCNQDISYPKKRIAKAKQLIDEINNGKIYRISN